MMKLVTRAPSSLVSLFNLDLSIVLLISLKLKASVLQVFVGLLYFYHKTLTLKVIQNRLWVNTDIILLQHGFW